MLRKLEALVQAHDPTKKTLKQQTAEAAVAVDRREREQLAAIAAKDVVAVTDEELRTLVIAMARRQFRRGGML